MSTIAVAAWRRAAIRVGSFDPEFVAEQQAKDARARRVRTGVYVASTVGGAYAGYTIGTASGGGVVGGTTGAVVGAVAGPIVVTIGALLLWIGSRGAISL